MTANIAGRSQGAILPGVGTKLPTLDSDTSASLVIPDSSFIDQHLDAVQSLPFQPFGHDLGADIVIGRAGDNRYTAGMGWMDTHGDNNVKLSLLRQQTVSDGFDGQWLASLQGKATPQALGKDFDLTAEVALAADNRSSQRTVEGSGVRLHLVRKPVNGFSYGLTLGQFSAGFHPYGSVVDAGERRAAVKLNYAPWPGTNMTADADYILRHWDGDVPCGGYRTDLSLSSSAFPSVLAKLETSTQRALDCGSSSGSGNIDSWALTLSEKTWTGWNINLDAGISTESQPVLNDIRIKWHYRLSGHHDLRLGSHLASFGPEVSLQTITDGDIQRRLQTGLVVNFDTASQNISLHLGYESLTDSDGTVDDASGNIKLNYRLDFDA